MDYVETPKQDTEPVPGSRRKDALIAASADARDVRVNLLEPKRRLGRNRYTPTWFVPLALTTASQSRSHLS